MPQDSRRRWWPLAMGGVVVLVAVMVYVLPRGEKPAAPGPYTTAYVRWQAPTTGAAAVSYKVRIQDVQGAAEDTFQVAAQAGSAQSFAFTRARPGHEYRACLAGIDARGRQGPWSGWSPVYHRQSTAEKP
jgi:hypothetical protein